MKNSENVATAKKVRTSKNVKNEIIIIETLPIKKVGLNRIQKAIKMLAKVSGVSQENLISFLIKNLASQDSKVKIADYLTKMVLRIASGTLEIKENSTSASEMFIEQMVEKFGLNKLQLENFIINDLSTKKKVVLNSYFKDLFFKASMKPEFVTKINSFKRF